MKQPIAIELFSGAGGLSLGLRQAGFHIALANEIEPEFAQTYQYNHPETKLICDDIHHIDFSLEATHLHLPQIDLLSGGPPCQGFSTVGSKNEKDPRNSLFYEYLRAVYELQPSYIVFENVSGFFNLYQGKAHQTLIQELQALGYETTSTLLDASDFGLPQIRKRAFVIGWQKQLPAVQAPTPTHGEANNIFKLPKKLTLMEAISDLPPLSINDTKTEYATPPQNSYQAIMRQNAKQLTEHNSANYGEKMQEILATVPPGGSVNDLPERLRPKKYFANTYARLYPDQPAPTITRNFGTPSSSRCIHPYQNRALSTREGARLQSFPDDYHFIGSKTAKNLQIGNAVPPLLGKMIAQEIFNTLHPQATLVASN